jgi:hypothetical protein
MIKKITHIILVLISVISLMIPGIGMIHPIFKTKPLNGVYLKQEVPEFSVRDWINFEYQPQLHRYLLENYHLRPMIIRIFNQIQFSVFDHYNPAVVRGIDDNLFESWFVDYHYGDDFLGDEKIKSQAKMLTEIRQELHESGKELLVVIAPSKADYWPDYIPESYDRPMKRTNWEAYAHWLSAMDVPAIDVNTWFMQARDTAVAPLFPKTGTHWSYYGAAAAFDSIVKLASHQFGKPLPPLKMQDFRLKDNLIEEDKDLENLLNLLYPLHRYPLAYPRVDALVTDSSFVPRTTVISDSFFWNIYNMVAPRQTFSDLQFWYYNSTVYYTAGGTGNTKNISLYEELPKTDLFILMACPATIHDLGWGFIQLAHRVIVEGEPDIAPEKMLEELIRKYKAQIENWAEWKQQVKEKALEKDLTYEEMLHIDARWLAEREMEKMGYRFKDYN